MNNQKLKQELKGLFILCLVIIVFSAILYKFENLKSYTYDPTKWNPCCNDCKPSCTDIVYDNEKGMCRYTMNIGNTHYSKPYKHCFNTEMTYSQNKST